MDEIIKKQELCLSRILELKNKVKSLEECRELSCLRDIWWNSFDFLVFPGVVFPFEVSLNFMEIENLL